MPYIYSICKILYGDETHQCVDLSLLTEQPVNAERAVSAAFGANRQHETSTQSQSPPVHS